MGRSRVDQSLVYSGRGKWEGERWVGGGLTSPLYTEGGVMGEGERWVGAGLTCPLYSEGG